MDLAEFFTGYEKSRVLFDALAGVVAQNTPASIRLTKSQVAFWDGRPFLWVWIPDRYLQNRKTAPLVMTVVFRQRDPSLRWKEIVEARPGRFTHHLELFIVEDIDQEVQDWIFKAYGELQQKT